MENLLKVNTPPLCFGRRAFLAGLEQVGKDIEEAPIAPGPR